MPTPSMCPRFPMEDQVPSEPRIGSKALPPGNDDGHAPWSTAKPTLQPSQFTVVQPMGQGGGWLVQAENDDRPQMPPAQPKSFRMGFVGAQEMAPVSLNVYWMQAVRLEDVGRATHPGSCNSSIAMFPWSGKFIDDILGVYHMGVEVHGCEYTFGNYSAPLGKQLGGPSGGVYVHAPKRPGPQYTLKETVDLGATWLSEAEVEVRASHFGAEDFVMNSYSKLEHNCVDFAKLFCQQLGAAPPPTWCHRGLSTVRFLGLAGTSLPTQEGYVVAEKTPLGGPQKRVGGKSASLWQVSAEGHSPAGSCNSEIDL
eukprot:TRINITY_DN25808_c0_g1_i1.p1 TRINITY_DN25808_c0_g1~~TRINITY_DN25808_c0_g1_i1.p1  ORF type:complete len:311 (+),score=68.66 TRINITY_DN25808_c0_g1_i1:122-1054(+)